MVSETQDTTDDDALMQVQFSVSRATYSTALTLTSVLNIDMDALFTLGVLNMADRIGVPYESAA